MSANQLKVTQVRSVIGQTQKTRQAVRGLGLRKMHQSVLHADRPEIRGMVQRVHHLVSVQEVPATEGAEA